MDKDKRWMTGIIAVVILVLIVLAATGGLKIVFPEDLQIRTFSITDSDGVIKKGGDISFKSTVFVNTELYNTYNLVLFYLVTDGAVTINDQLLEIYNEPAGEHVYQNFYEMTKIDAPSSVVRDERTVPFMVPNELCGHKFKVFAFPYVHTNDGYEDALYGVMSNELLYDCGADTGIPVCEELDVNCCYDGDVYVSSKSLFGGGLFDNTLVQECGGKSCYNGSCGDDKWLSLLKSYGVVIGALALFILYYLKQKKKRSK